MTYEEFEWHILRMVYENGLERIQPAYVAYAMGLPHEKASEYLERAAQAGVLELDVTDDGSIEYFVPGADPNAPMPDPVWREDQQQAADEQADGDEAIERAADGAAGGEVGAEPEPQGRIEAEPEQERLPVEREEQPRPEPAGSTARDGEVTTATKPRPEKSPSGRPPEGKGADGTVGQPGRGNVPATSNASSLPAPLKEHIEQREESTDGTLDASRGGRRTVVDRDASVNAEEKPQVVAALENSDSDLPIHIESTEETFSDPSQTIFMRQLRVEGVESEEALREHVHRLFDSLGYQIVDSDEERMRFERGSVTFILALVPLFVLVLPLFVYLFLYCMGRSTIHQEPLELDVQIREQPGREDAYEVDLTFIGLHGVVLGAADQRVLDKEVDTLQDELRWALTTG
jgi:hypothetical protein